MQRTKFMTEKIRFCRINFRWTWKIAPIKVNPSRILHMHWIYFMRPKAIGDAIPMLMYNVLRYTASSYENAILDSQIRTFSRIQRSRGIFQTETFQFEVLHNFHIFVVQGTGDMGHGAEFIIIEICNFQF